MTNAVITLIMTAFGSLKAKKKGITRTAADYGFAGPGEKLEVRKIGRALLMGVIIVATVYAWVELLENVLGINYQVWNLLNISAIPANIGMNTSRRLADTGNPNRDMAKQIALNVFVSAGVIRLLLLAQYGIGWATGHYMMPQLENVGAAPVPVH